MQKVRQTDVRQEINCTFTMKEACLCPWLEKGKKKETAIVRNCTSLESSVKDVERSESETKFYI